MIKEWKICGEYCGGGMLSGEENGSPNILPTNWPSSKERESIDPEAVFLLIIRINSWNFPLN